MKEKEIRFTREEWEAMADRLRMTAGVFGRVLDKLLADSEMVSDTERTVCVEEYRADIYCALQAMSYVGEFAADRVWLAVEN